ncbi:chaperone protein DnaJ isoform X2 [Vigna umbellata]|uniref:chaperone protein DnaJ isoform X2 n=1 Tax=Vigna umbellata TaxID=87088 RepID=UPI001F5EE201|nr:chaperone protein DnaJ isoform X2 [Vigna umbellata]
MQSHLVVGSISIGRYGGAADSSPFHSAAPSCWTNPPRRRTPLVVASSSPTAINGGQNHYAVLGVACNATAVEIKRAYRLLARKYHPDVSKDPHSEELFKSIRHAYEVLSNEATRVQYDQELHFSHNSHREKWSYSTEFEDQVRVYRWAHLRKKMHSERYWEHGNVSEDYNSETEEEEDEENLDEQRGSFIEVLRSAFLSLFLFQTFGSRLSLTFSGLTALLDQKLDTGYKIGWVCGKTSSSVVALIVVAMWVGSYLARYAPLPQGALLALLYMSIKLQSDLI